MVPLNDTDGSLFIELQSVDSTNNYATGLIHAGMAQHGVTVFAHEQNKGKGQRNKQWITQKSANIILSNIIEPQELSLNDFFPFSMSMAVATCRFINNYAVDSVSIKWPNDIMWCDRKAGGILIENILQGQQWKYAVVGVGLNINQTNFEGLQNKAVSLKQITGKDYNVISLAKELCSYLMETFIELKQNKPAITSAYHQHLYKLKEVVKFKKQTRLFEATVKGVVNDGRLKVQHGMEELLEIGSVEWVI